VTATPIQPTTGERNAKKAPVAARARPRVTVWPEKFITYAKANTATTVRIVQRNWTTTPIRVANARLTDTRYSAAVRMPATSSTVPPALNTARLKVAVDNGFPALLRTSRPGQANVQPEWVSRKFFSGPNETSVNKPTTNRYGAKAINASPLPTGPEFAGSAPVPPPDPPVGPTGCNARALSAARISDGCHTRSSSTSASAPESAAMMSATW